VSDNDHWHYASDIHGGAEEHHRHYDLERQNERLHDELMQAVKRISNLEDRIASLEKSTPGARQAQHEADVAMADLRASGWSEEEDYR
jgi:hypothetical protein